MTTTYRRRPYGWLRADGEWFMERGGTMSDASGTAWLLWRPVTPDDRPEQNTVGSWYSDAAGGCYLRTTAEVTGDDRDTDDRLWIHVGDEGWLEDAKATAERHDAEKASAA